MCTQSAISISHPLLAASLLSLMPSALERLRRLPSKEHLPILNRICTYRAHSGIKAHIEMREKTHEKLYSMGSRRQFLVIDIHLLTI